MSHNFFDHIFTGSTKTEAGQRYDLTQILPIEPAVEKSALQVVAKAVNWSEEESLKQDKTSLFLSALKINEMSTRYIKKHKGVPSISRLESEESPGPTGIMPMSRPM